MAKHTYITPTSSSFPSSNSKEDRETEESREGEEEESDNGEESGEELEEEDSEEDEEDSQEYGDEYYNGPYHEVQIPKGEQEDEELTSKLKSSQPKRWRVESDSESQFQSQSESEPSASASKQAKKLLANEDKDKGKCKTEEFAQLYPCLHGALSSNHFEVEHPNIYRKYVHLMDPCRLREMDHQWRDLYLKDAEYKMFKMGIVSGQIKLLLDAAKLHSRKEASSLSSL